MYGVVTTSMEEIQQYMNIKMEGTQSIHISRCLKPKEFC